MLLHLLCMAVQPDTFAHVQHLFLYSITLYFSSAFMIYARAFPFVDRGGSRQTIAATCIYDTYETAILPIVVIYS